MDRARTIRRVCEPRKGSSTNAHEMAGWLDVASAPRQYQAGLSLEHGNTQPTDAGERRKRRSEPDVLQPAEYPIGAVPATVVDAVVAIPSRAAV